MRPIGACVPCGAKGLAPATIHRSRQAFSPQPDQNKSFKFSKDLLFVDDVRDLSDGIRIRPRTLWFIV